MSARLTLSQAAARAGITTASLREAIARGRLPAERHMHMWIVTEADLDAYLASRWQDSPRHSEWWQRRREQQAESE